MNRFSVDCLIKMEEDKADFAVVTTEEAIMAVSHRPDRYEIIATVRNKEKMYRKWKPTHSIIIRTISFVT